MTAAVRMRWLAVVLAGLCGMVLVPGATGYAAASHGQARRDLAAVVPASVADSLFAVAALGKSDAWAVGKRELGSDSGTVLTLTEHWDGKSWQVVPSPSPAGTGQQAVSILEAVAIDSPSDGWAVGKWSRGALLEHWNGAKWTVVPGPRSGVHADELFSVAAISPTAAWAIGVGTAAGGRGVTVFMAWDGTRWRYLPSPVGDFPGGLAVISAHDIWLVGEAGATKSVPKYHTLVEHWNGSKWMIVPAPYAFKSRAPNVGLSAVGGSSGRNVWAVGSYRSGPRGADASPLVEHWDGARWHVQPAPDPVPLQDDGFLNGIAAVSRASAWASGSAFGRGSIAIVEGWNGVHWMAKPIGLEPGVTDPFPFGVAAVDPGYAWVVGYAHDQNYRPITLIEKWNGSSWQQVPSPNP